MKSLNHLVKNSILKDHCIKMTVWAWYIKIALLVKYIMNRNAYDRVLS